MFNSLKESINTSIFDVNNPSQEKYQLKIINNVEENMLSIILEELTNCDEFILSAAFLTPGGVSSISSKLLELKEKNIKGKILTGNYLYFTDPKAIKFLIEQDNLEVKMLNDQNFHAKGFFFRKGDIWSIIIGSSNLTKGALLHNREWNIKLNSINNGAITIKVLKEFNNLFNLSVNAKDYINEYEEKYNEEKNKRAINNNNTITIYSPNEIQIEALDKLDILRKNGEKKAIVIAATGTGKTYLSAFDVEQYFRIKKDAKILFIVHRDNIINSAINSYKNIFPNKKIGKFNKKEKDFDITFAMIQTLSNKENRKQFNEEYFDYIIIDEVHRSGASTYEKILNYFKPKFLLGMTATPYRTDGKCIFSKFDNNIAQELYLHDALEKEYLCPFHYFGVSDIIFDELELNDKNDLNEDVNILELTSDNRIKHIVEKINYYSLNTSKVKGLIFVSKVDEAIELANKLGNYDISAKPLTGSDSAETREEVIQELKDGVIDYIVSVDIFNEGIDIPEVNQIVLLRSTQSAIIYTQQLGRGLRKHDSKEFVNVIDFIGNYKGNYNNIMAITGDFSYNKEKIKRVVESNKKEILGNCIMNFEEIAKEKIIKTINLSSISVYRQIKNDYNFLETRKGSFPLLEDFQKSKTIDPDVIIDYDKTYIEIVSELSDIKFNENELNIYEMIQKKFSPGKRIHEFLILKNLMNSDYSIEELNNIIEEYISIKEQFNNTENALGHLERKFFTKLSHMKKFKPLVTLNNNKYSLTSEFKNCLKNENFKILMIDLINYNINFVESNYRQINKSTLLLGKSYTRFEMMRLSNIDNSFQLEQSGIAFNDDIKEMYLFFSLNSDKIYDNKLENDRTIKWFSQGLCKDAKNPYSKKIKDGYKIKLFAKITGTTEYYYLGNPAKIIDVKEEINEKEKFYNYYFELDFDITEEMKKNIL